MGKQMLEEVYSVFSDIMSVKLLTVPTMSLDGKRQLGFMA